MTLTDERRSRSEEAAALTLETSHPRFLSRTQHVVFLAILCVAVLVVYGRVISFDFVVWDDTIEVYRNPRLNPVTADGVASFWAHPYQHLYIPLSYTIYALLALVARIPPGSTLTETGALLNPHVFHAANLLLHLVNAALVFTILRRMTRSDRAAFFGSLLFALHPLQVESVAWVSELRGLLAALLMLTALLVFLRWAQGEETQRWWIPAGGVGVGGLALLAKPSAVCLGALVFSFDHWLLGGTWRRSAARATAWIAIALPFVLLTQSAQPVQSTIIPPVMLRPVIAGDAITFDLWKLVMPVGLGIDYGRTPVAVLSSPVTWLTAAAGPLALLSLAEIMGDSRGSGDSV